MKILEVDSGVDGDLRDQLRMTLLSMWISEIDSSIDGNPRDRL